MSPKDARQAGNVLATHTGWQMSEMLDWDGEELVAWLDECPKRVS